MRIRKTSWREKLVDSNGPPKVEAAVRPAVSARWGRGTVVVPAPTGALIKDAREARVATANELRETLALGGVPSLKQRLEAEGRAVVKRGQDYFLPDFEHSLFPSFRIIHKA